MVVLLLSLTLLLCVLVVVLAVRALILFPVAIYRQGLQPAVLHYRLSVAFIFALLLFELGSLTGFSWKHFRYIGRKEIADAAVLFSYPDIYSNVHELRNDYSHFEPEVRYWGNWSSQSENGLLQKLAGAGRYEVRLPEEIVTVNVDGKAEFSRRNGDCPPDNSCPIVQPDNPERGIVGTVQMGTSDYPIVKDFLVRWQDGKGGPAFVSGHCFSMHRSSADGGAAWVLAGGNATTMRTGAGFYLVAIIGNTYASTRISKAEFLRSRSCDPAVRQNWPNIGGWAWKR